MALHVIDEANRCLQCKNPQCMKGCPVSINIPAFIEQVLQRMLDQGVTPVLAHVERYLASQDIMQVAEIISLGLPAQITASEFLRLSTRRKALKALNLRAHVIATDCHNADSRKPCMGQAMDVVARKLGRGTADRLCAMAETLVG